MQTTLSQKIIKKVSTIALIGILALSASVAVHQVQAVEIDDLGAESGLTSGGSNTVNTGNGSQLQVGEDTGFGSGSTLPKPELSVSGIVLWFVKLLNYIVVLILTASLIVFLYGVFKLSFVDGTNPESMAKSRKFMLWGIISLFVMVSVWGLVNVLKSSLFGNGPLIGPQFK